VVIPTHWATKIGGAQYQGKALIEHLVGRRDIDIHFVGRRIRAIHQPEGYRIHEVGKRRPIAGTFLADVPSFWMALRRIRPDVIYQRVACTYTGVAALYARRAHARLVWHVAHDSDVQPSPRSSSASVSSVLSRFDERIIDYGIRHADAIVVQTQHQADLLLRHYGRNDSTLIPNFHPLPDVLPDRQPEPVTITWVANIKPFKRPEVFVRLAEDFRNRPNVRLIMIGAPPLSNPEWPTLLAKIQALPNLLYLGGLSQEQVNDWLARSHVFVNTSESEGFANTFIQAWMRGTPVVSLDVDPDGLLASRMYGYCASGDYHALRRHVETLIDDPELRRMLSEQAKRHSRATYSYTNIESLVEVLLHDTAAIESDSPASAIDSQ